MKHNRMLSIAVMAAGVSLVMLAAVGCAKKANDAGNSATVLDVSAPPPAAVAYEPPPPQPAPATPAYDPAAPAVTSTPSAPASSVGGGGGNYVVQKGDTLYGIARQRYGDGKQWQRIAQANPGVSPQSLRVGQTLVIP